MEPERQPSSPGSEKDCNYRWLKRKPCRSAENPDRISKVVLDKGLDSGTAFEILSIDIADVDVGRNIGARLQMDQAEADKNIAQAKAAERRFAAQAREQEMRAATQEMRAQVVQAEAEVPRAIADALRAGNLGVMDFYGMQNIMADTSMRENIGGRRPERDPNAHEDENKR